jgi:SAM-dependent methyltransferase
MDRSRWDELADEFEDNVCDILAVDKDRVLDGLMANLTLPAQRPVLADLGCGIGTFIERYGSRFDKVIGVDTSPRILARAREKCAHLPRATWIATGIPAAVRRLGRIAHLTVCFNVITSPSHSKRRALWRSLGDVTRAKGLLLLVVPSLESAELAWSEKQRRGVEAPRPDSEGLLDNDGDWQKYFALDELGASLEQHGFTSRSIQKIPYAWRDEGIHPPRREGVPDPWDWLCVAERV